MENNYFVALIIYGTLLLIMLIGVIILFMVIHKQRMQRYQQELLHTRIEVQEQALDWVSREIHDNVGQVLSIIRMQLKPELYADSAEMEAQMSDASEQIEKCIRDLRTMSHTLNSGMIEKMGLKASIEKELSYVRSLHKLDCELSCNQDPEVTKEQNLLLFRITQECLNNIIKHAKATTVKVTLDASQKEFKLMIEDNGTGMDPNKLIGSNGMGLVNIRQRVGILKGKLTMKSEKGKGTQITITLKRFKDEKTHH